MQYESILFKVIDMRPTESLANVAEAFYPPPLQSQLIEISKERERAFQDGSEAKEKRSYQNNFYIFA